MAIWPGQTDPTVTVDVWLLEDDDRLLILTRGVRGRPSPATLESLNLTLEELPVRTDSIARPRLHRHPDSWSGTPTTRRWPVA